MVLSDNHKWILIRSKISLPLLAKLLTALDGLSYYEQAQCLWTNDFNLKIDKGYLKDHFHSLSCIISLIKLLPCD